MEWKKVLQNAKFKVKNAKWKKGRGQGFEGSSKQNEVLECCSKKGKCYGLRTRTPQFAKPQISIAVESLSGQFPEACFE